MPTRRWTCLTPKLVRARARTRARVFSRMLACVLGGVLMAPTAQAQRATPMALVRGLGGRDAAAGADSTGAAGWHLEQCLAGITYGAPLKWAVSYGGGYLRESITGPDLCALAVAKLGIGGAQGSLGLGSSFSPWGSGVMVTANVLRTFGAPLKATPRRTYVGASVHLWPILALGGEVGYYTRLGDAPGASSSAKHLLTWSAGFGF